MRDSNEKDFLLGGRHSFRYTCRSIYRRTVKGRPHASGEIRLFEHALIIQAEVKQTQPSKSRMIGVSSIKTARAPHYSKHIVMLFSELGLLPELVAAVEAKGYTDPSPIQARAIPAVLEGRDVLGGAQTGTGKTAAFSLPMLQILVRSGV